MFLHIFLLTKLSIKVTDGCNLCGCLYGHLLFPWVTFFLWLKYPWRVLYFTATVTVNLFGQAGHHKKIKRKFFYEIPSLQVLTTCSL